jgi:hypothetical protein
MYKNSVPHAEHRTTCKFAVDLSLIEISCPCSPDRRGWSCAGDECCRSKSYATEIAQSVTHVWSAGCHRFDHDTIICLFGVPRSPNHFCYGIRTRMGVRGL